MAAMVIDGKVMAAKVMEEIRLKTENLKTPKMTKNLIKNLKTLKTTKPKTKNLMKNSKASKRKRLKPRKKLSRSRGLT